MSKPRQIFLIEPKKHWFLSYLKIWELLTVIIITFLFLLGLYHKLDFILGIVISALIGLGWFFLLKYSKNYEVLSEVIKENSDWYIKEGESLLKIKSTEPSLDFDVKSEYWPYKQVSKTPLYTIYSEEKIFTKKILVID